MASLVRHNKTAWISGPVSQAPGRFHAYRPESIRSRGLAQPSCSMKPRRSFRVWQVTAAVQCGS
jgi:hypothetical protein